MKKSIISITWGQIPQDQWITITLLNPSECRPIYIPTKGHYVAYRAYFKHLGPDKIFDIVFPTAKLDRAIKALPADLKKVINKPVTFEMMKGNRQTIYIRNYTIQKETKDLNSIKGK